MPTFQTDKGVITADTVTKAAREYFAQAIKDGQAALQDGAMLAFKLTTEAGITHDYVVEVKTAARHTTLPGGVRAKLKLVVHRANARPKRAPLSSIHFTEPLIDTEHPPVPAPAPVPAPVPPAPVPAPPGPVILPPAPPGGPPPASGPGGPGGPGSHFGTPSRRSTRARRGGGSGGLPPRGLAFGGGAGGGGGPVAALGAVRVTGDGGGPAAPVGEIPASMSSYTDPVPRMDAVSDGMGGISRSAVDSHALDISGASASYVSADGVGGYNTRGALSGVPDALLGSIGGLLPPRALGANKYQPFGGVRVTHGTAPLFIANGGDAFTDDLAALVGGQMHALEPVEEDPDIDMNEDDAEDIVGPGNIGGLMPAPIGARVKFGDGQLNGRNLSRLISNPRAQDDIVEEKKQLAGIGDVTVQIHDDMKRMADGFGASVANMRDDMIAQTRAVVNQFKAYLEKSLAGQKAYTASMVDEIAKARPLIKAGVQLAAKIPELFEKYEQKAQRLGNALYAKQKAMYLKKNGVDEISDVDLGLASIDAKAKGARVINQGVKGPLGGAFVNGVSREMDEDEIDDEVTEAAEELSADEVLVSHAAANVAGYRAAPVLFKHSPQAAGNVAAAMIDGMGKPAGVADMKQIAKNLKDAYPSDGKALAAWAKTTDNFLAEFRTVFDKLDIEHTNILEPLTGMLGELREIKDLLAKGAGMAPPVAAPGKPAALADPQAKPKDGKQPDGKKPDAKEQEVDSDEENAGPDTDETENPSEHRIDAAESKINEDKKQAIQGAILPQQPPPAKPGNNAPPQQHNPAGGLNIVPGPGAVPVSPQKPAKQNQSPQKRVQFNPDVDVAPPRTPAPAQSPAKMPAQPQEPPKAKKNAGDIVRDIKFFIKEKNDLGTNDVDDRVKINRDIRKLVTELIDTGDQAAIQQLRAAVSSGDYYSVGTLADLNMAVEQAAKNPARPPAQPPAQSPAKAPAQPQAQPPAKPPAPVASPVKSPVKQPEGKGNAKSDAVLNVAKEWLAAESQDEEAKAESKLQAALGSLVRQGDAQAIARVKDAASNQRGRYYNTPILAMLERLENPAPAGDAKMEDDPIEQPEFDPDGLTDTGNLASIATTNMQRIGARLDKLPSNVSLYDALKLFDVAPAFVAKVTSDTDVGKEWKAIRIRKDALPYMPVPSPGMTAEVFDRYMKEILYQFEADRGTSKDGLEHIRKQAAIEAAAFTILAIRAMSAQDTKSGEKQLLELKKWAEHGRLSETAKNFINESTIPLLTVRSADAHFIPPKSKKPMDVVQRSPQKNKQAPQNLGIRQLQKKPKE